MSDLVERLEDERKLVEMDSSNKREMLVTLDLAITALSQQPGDVEEDFRDYQRSAGTVHIDDCERKAFHAAHSLYARRMAEKDARIAELDNDRALYENIIITLRRIELEGLAGTLVTSILNDAPISQALKGDSDA